MGDFLSPFLCLRYAAMAQLSQCDKNIEISLVDKILFNKYNN